jgi:hypothetical protein
LFVANENSMKLGPVWFEGEKEEGKKIAETNV